MGSIPIFTTMRDKDTFVRQVLDGKITDPIKAIENFIDAWRNDDSEESLNDYLGMTDTELSLFVKNPKNLSLIFDAQNDPALTELLEHDIHIDEIDERDKDDWMFADFDEYTKSGGLKSRND